MDKWKEFAKQIEKYLRPQTFPIGLKVIRDKGEFPVNAKSPKDLGIQIALCQANTLARRYGWTVAVRPEDIICIPVHLGFGWKNAEYVDQVNFFQEMGYVKDKTIAEDRIRSLEITRRISGRLNLDKKGISFCLFPLEKTQVEPDLVYIYGNPAQIMRLVQGYIYHTGKPIVSSSSAAGACLDGILETLDKREPRIVLSGNGERVFAMTYDDEMMFATPAEKIEMIIEGLSVSHMHGQRYPIPVYQFFTPRFISPFIEFGKKLK